MQHGTRQGALTEQCGRTVRAWVAGEINERGDECDVQVGEQTTRPGIPKFECRWWLGAIMPRHEGQWLTK